MCFSFYTIYSQVSKLLMYIVFFGAFDVRIVRDGKFRLGQSRDAKDIDEMDHCFREGRSQSKRKHRMADRLTTNNEAHDPDAMFLLPDPSPWMYLPEATLIWRHSKIVDLELDDGKLLRASLAGKLKGVKLVVGDRLRYQSTSIEDGNKDLSQAQIVAVMPRRTLLKRGGIDDREPWQLICANADELWICVAMTNPPLRLGLIERAQALALSSGLGFRVIVTKIDQACVSDILFKLEPLCAQELSIFATSATEGSGLDLLRMVLQNKRVVLMGHSGVGKSTLVNKLLPNLNQRTGEMSRYGTGKQTTTGARWFSCGRTGAIIDTPGIRNLSVRGLSRALLTQVFPEMPARYFEDPMSLSFDDEIANLKYPERLLNLQRLWLETEERNPNQNIYR